MRLHAAVLAVACSLAALALAERVEARDRSPWRGKEKDRPLVEVLLRLADADAGARIKAAEELAERDDPSILGVLDARLAVETEFHARLALHYARATHGERSSMLAIAESHPGSGNLGAVYFNYARAGLGPPCEWGKWREWVDGVTDEQWREWMKRVFSPWVATDAGEAGLMKAIAWWDGLGYPDVGTLPFVIVDTGESWPAFLLEDGPDRFRVFTHGLRTIAVAKGEPGKSGAPQGRFERADLGPFVLAHVPMPKPEREGIWGGPPMEGDPLALAGDEIFVVPQLQRLFVLAVACWKRGAKEAALRLWDGLSLEAPWGQEAPPWTTLDHMKSEMGRTEKGRVLRLLGDPAVSASEVLGQFREWLRRFGPSEWMARSAQAVERMAAEDERRRRIPPKPWASMSPEEQIEDCVYRLREPGGSPGYGVAEPKPGSPPTAQTPYEVLVKIGMPAVPRLIRALEDESFSRAPIPRDMYCGSSFPRQAPLPRIERVGDLALFALREITGEDFSREDRRPHYIYNDWGSVFDEGKVPAIAARAKAWWSDREARGDRATLVEGVSRGDTAAVDLARRLLDRDPDAAAAAILAGIRAIRDDGHDPEARRDLLLALLGKAEGAAAAEFLRGEAGGDVSAHRRIGAARVLWQRGDDSGVRALLSTPPSLDDFRDAHFPLSSPREDLSTLWADVLSGRRRIEFLRAFEGRLPDIPAETRFAVLDAIGVASGARPPPTASGGWPWDAPPSPAAEPVPWSPDDLEALESLLVALLPDDADDPEGLSSSGAATPARRAGEEARVVLASRWPNRYPASVRGSHAAGVRRRVELANAWRVEHGKPPLPLPSASLAPPAVPEDSARPPLDAFLAARDAAARAAAGKALEEMGLGVLPAVLARLEALPADAPSRSDLAALSVRLANRVVSVAFEPGAKPDDAIRTFATSLVGTALTGQVVDRLFGEAMRGAPERYSVVRIALFRDADLSGVALRIGLDRRDVPPGRREVGFGCRSLLRAGSEWVRGPSGWTNRDNFRQFWADGFDDVLSRPPRVEIEASNRVTFSHP